MGEWSSLRVGCTYPGHESSDLLFMTNSRFVQPIVLRVHFSKVSNVRTEMTCLVLLPLSLEHLIQWNGIGTKLVPLSIPSITLLSLSLSPLHSSSSSLLKFNESLAIVISLFATRNWIIMISYLVRFLITPDSNPSHQN